MTSICGLSTKNAGQNMLFNGFCAKKPKKVSKRKKFDDIFNKKTCFLSLQQSAG